MTAWQWTGTAFAFSGVAVIAWSDFHFNAEHFRGDLICVGSIWICALYVAAGRRNRRLFSSSPFLVVVASPPP